jgi:hypothetical protein
MKIHLELMHRLENLHCFCSANMVSGVSVQVSGVRCQERSLDAKIVWPQDRRHESLLG